MKKYFNLMVRVSLLESENADWRHSFTVCSLFFYKIETIRFISMYGFKDERYEKV